MFLGKSGMSGCCSATLVAHISTTCAIMSARYRYYFSLMRVATQSLRPLGYKMRYQCFAQVVIVVQRCQLRASNHSFMGIVLLLLTILEQDRVVHLHVPNATEGSHLFKCLNLRLVHYELG